MGRSETGQGAARAPRTSRTGAPPIGRAVPISRLNLDEYNLLTVHT
ncbi:hypothetical protein [Bordetella pertussis]|nr:hypothetical protein [Bordetella pertussis]